MGCSLAQFKLHTHQNNQQMKECAVLNKTFLSTVSRNAFNHIKGFLFM